MKQSEVMGGRSRPACRKRGTQVYRATLGHVRLYWCLKDKMHGQNRNWSPTGAQKRAYLTGKLGSAQPHVV